MDRDTIKLLASDTRSNIIKTLVKRRKTLSEISKELGLAPATVTEQLKALEKGGMVRKMDEGRKWKYYELTKKSVEVTTPATPVFLVIATVAVILFAGVFFSASMFGSASAPKDASVGIAPLAEAEDEGDAVALTGSKQGPLFDFSPVGTAAEPQMITGVCYEGTLKIRNPTEESIEGILNDELNGVRTVTIAAGVELEEGNVTNGTLYTDYGSMDYFC